MWQNKKPYLLVMPALLFISILFIGGIFEGFFQSVGLTPIIGVSQFSINHYKELVTSNDFYKSFFLTLRVAIISTIISCLFGMLIIFLLFIIRSGKEKGKALIYQRFFQIPIIFPYLVAGYLIFLILIQSGWISRILFNIGLIQKISNFPVLVNDEFGLGIIIAYVWKTSPFVVLMLYPIILKIESSWIEVGRVFGANRYRFFIDIVFPLLKHTWKMTGFIIFSYTFLAFEVPYLLGVTYPKMLSVYSYQIYTNGDLIDRPKALAINIIIILFIALIGLIYFKSNKLNLWERRKIND